VFDTNAVFSVIKILDKMFNAYEKKKNISSFSIKFNYNLLKQATRVIVENDHSLTLAKVFWLYYKNSHIMNIEHIADVCDNVSGQKFYKYFFHWSWQVRNIYYYFILYTIDYRLRNVNYNPIKQGETIRNSDNKASEYKEKLRTSIVKEMNNHLRVVEKVRDIIKLQNLDPTFNNKFYPANTEEISEIPLECYKNIVVSLHHFNSVEEQYKKWKDDNKNSLSTIIYPELILTPPKDDVIDYSENW
jgi:hypothetical protein